MTPSVGASFLAVIAATVVVGGLLMGDMRTLERYLQDHHAGGTAGVALARRLATDDATEDSVVLLTGVAREIEEDLRVLEHLMASLGIQPSRPRDAAVRLGHVGTRVRRLVARDASRRRAIELLELELLEMGITGKRLLWITMRNIGAGEDAHLEKLIARATNQQARVETVRLRLISDGFQRGGAHPSGGASGQH